MMFQETLRPLRSLAVQQQPTAMNSAVECDVQLKTACMSVYSLGRYAVFRIHTGSETIRRYRTCKTFFIKVVDFSSEIFLSNAFRPIGQDMLWAHRCYRSIDSVVHLRP
jgi:hypothetical protein